MNKLILFSLLVTIACAPQPEENTTELQSTEFKCQDCPTDEQIAVCAEYNRALDAGEIYEMDESEQLEFLGVVCE